MRKGRRASAGRARAQAAPRWRQTTRSPQAERHIFADGEVLERREMLEHHADAELRKLIAAAPEARGVAATPLTSRSAASRAGFNLLTEFQQELRTDLHNALRTARRAFLKHGFMCPRSEYPKFSKILRDTGWRTDKREAQDDYDAVAAELFDADGRWRRPPNRSVARA
jgi:hypothetical protein